MFAVPGAQDGVSWDVLTLNENEQGLQSQGRRMEWVRGVLTLNENEQCLQCQGRRLVCVRMCFFSMLGFLQRIPHSSHTYLQPVHPELKGLFTLSPRSTKVMSPLDGSS